MSYPILRNTENGEKLHIINAEFLKHNKQKHKQLLQIRKQVETTKKPPQIRNKKLQHSTNNIQQDTQIRNNMKPQDSTKKTQQNTTRHHKIPQDITNKTPQDTTREHK